jgi:hypothetical protein
MTLSPKAQNALRSSVGRHVANEIFAELTSLAITPAAALTAQVTTITHTAPDPADYALQDMVEATGFGFATADEGNTLLAVVANLQTRLAEVEAALEAAGIVTAN